MNIDLLKVFSSLLMAEPFEMVALKIVTKSAFKLTKKIKFLCKLISTGKSGVNYNRT